MWVVANLHRHHPSARLLLLTEEVGGTNGDGSNRAAVPAVDDVAGLTVALRDRHVRLRVGIADVRASHVDSVMLVGHGEPFGRCNSANCGRLL